MLAPMNEEIARIRGEELREQACRDRQERLAVKAAGSRKAGMFRRRRADPSCRAC